MALVRKGECACGLGACCKGFTLTFERIIDRDLVKYYKFHDVVVTFGNNKTHLRFNIPCNHLDPTTNRCRIYGKGRPAICLIYPRVEDIANVPKECTFKFEKE